MSIRQQLNKPAVGGTVIGVAVVVALVMFFLVGGSGGKPTVMLYYTSDDGATYFEAPAEAAPIQYQGKTAYEATIFACNDGKKFVGYMRRYPDNMRKAVDAAYKNRAPVPTAGSEIKNPKDTEWVVVDGPEATPMLHAGGGKTAMDVQNVVCPDGSGAMQYYAAN